MSTDLAAWIDRYKLTEWAPGDDSMPCPQCGERVTCGACRASIASVRQSLRTATDQITLSLGEPTP